MNRVPIHITLHEDTIFSERNATEGAHRGLAYAPGSTLLGIAATRLYPQLAPDDAFLLFHSGKLRFGNAYPLSATAQPTWPMPLCWHVAKGSVWKRHGRIDAAAVYRVLRGEGFPETGVADRRLQARQLYDGFVSADGGVDVQVSGRCMKTAIDPRIGRAAESQLFDYQTIPAQTRLQGVLTWDDDVPAPLLAQATQALHGERRLGRSRSAEFGTATIVVGAASRETAEPARRDEVLVWLLADLVPPGDGGGIDVRTSATELGLGGGRIDWDASMVRTRRFSPWNRARGGFDRERVVLCMGSVLVWHRDGHPALAGLHHLGLYTEAGLGQVWVDPDLLATPQPSFATPSPTTAAARDANADTVPAKEAPTPAGDAYADALAVWMQRRAVRQIDAQGGDRQRLRKLAQRILGWYAAIRAETGLGAEVAVGASATQWRSIVAMIESESRAVQNDAQRLHARVFQGTNALIAAHHPGWSDAFWSSEHRCAMTLGTAFERLLVAEALAGRACVLLCRDVAEAIARRDGDRVDKGLPREGAAR